MTHDTSGQQSKVARVIYDYGLDGIGAELERRWTRNENRSSLRDLAAFFNRQMLESAIDSSDLNPLDGEVDNIYRLLTNDDVTSGSRRETRTRLERAGIDVESLDEDFVSYQAIRTYLREYRDVESPTESRSPESYREAKRKTVQQLIGRLRTVATEALTELLAADHLVLGDFDVVVTVRVHCTDCGTRMALADLLERGGCECDD